MASEAPPPPDLIARIARAAFWTAAAGVLLAGCALASGNLHPGSPDALNNLVTAREIAEGRGYTTRIVHQFFVDQPVPGPETVRPPGIPFLVAALFWLFGASLAIPILVNVGFLLGAAFVVRAALRRLGSTSLADVGGVLVLASPAFEPMSLWNNGALVFFTALLFLVALLRLQGATSPTVGYIIVGLLGGVGLYMKESFLFTALLVFAALSLTDPSLATRRARLRAFGIAAGALAAVTSPWWARNLWLWGTPFYNPMSFARVVARYGGGPDGFGVWPTGSWWTVRYGRPFGLGDLVAQLGLLEVISRELAVVSKALLQLVKLNPIVTALAALCVGVAGKRRDATWVVAFALFGESAFSLLYTSVDTRYLWPATVPMILLAALALRDLGAQLTGLQAIAARRALAAVLALAAGLGASDAATLWGDRAQRSRLAPPPWGAAAAAAVPEGCVVLSDDPWAAAWFARRDAVMAPRGAPEDLRQVLERFQPSHFLFTAREGAQPLTPFSEEALELVASGRHGPRPWALFRIRAVGGAAPPCGASVTAPSGSPLVEETRSRAPASAVVGAPSGPVRQPSPRLLAVRVSRPPRRAAPPVTISASASSPAARARPGSPSSGPGRPRSSPLAAPRRPRPRARGRTPPRAARP